MPRGTSPRQRAWTTQITDASYPLFFIPRTTRLSRFPSRNHTRCSPSTVSWVAFLFLGKQHFRCFEFKFVISDFWQTSMTFDLVYHVRARARSLQLDKTALTPAMVALEQVAAQAQGTKRLSSLPDGQTPTVHFSVPAFVPAAIRRYRSMLEVDEPPRLSPWSPMSFEELYSGPVESAVVPDGDILSSDRSTRSCSWNTNPPNTVESQETELSSQKPAPSPPASWPCIVLYLTSS